MTQNDQHLMNLGIKPVHEEYFPLNPEEIVQLEKSVGSSLPGDYRDFISRYGCANFAASEVAIRPITAPPSDVSGSGILEVGVMLGGGGGYEISDYIEILEDRMPSNMIPIARDNSGNFFLIEPSNGGRVFFWSALHESSPEDFTDHDMEIPDDILFQNLTLVANSFSDFVSRLDSKQNL